MSVGQAMMTARNRRGWSQDRLAAEADVTQSQISRWEAGEAISAKNAEKIGKVLGVDLVTVRAEQENVSNSEPLPNVGRQIGDICAPGSGLSGSEASAKTAGLERPMWEELRDVKVYATDLAMENRRLRERILQLEEVIRDHKVHGRLNGNSDDKPKGDSAR